MTPSNPLRRLMISYRVVSGQPLVRRVDTSITLSVLALEISVHTRFYSRCIMVHEHMYVIVPAAQLFGGLLWEKSEQAARMSSMKPDFAFSTATAPARGIERSLASCESSHSAVSPVTRL